MEFTEAELTAFRAEYAKGATDTQFDLFISECKARQLRPGVHLVFQLRNAKEYDPTLNASVFVKKAYWITTVSALRLIAQRTGEYLGQAPDEFVYLDSDGLPTIKSEFPLPTSKENPVPREPWVARAKVYRKGFIEPMVGMARFEAYAATRKDGTQLVLTDMWAKRGSEQLQKCAEALALRKAYPEELGNLFIAEELRNEEEEKPIAVTPASVVPLPPSVPKVDQTPAVPTDAPRPNEGPKTVTGTLPAHSGSVLVVKDEAKEKALAAVPDLQPASALPPPEKKKCGPKPKESPVNGRDIASEGGITDADIANAGPAPEIVDQTEAAQQFVADLDPTPTQEEMKGFTARVRALTAKGKKSDDIKAHVLKVAGPPGQPETDTKKVTVGAWRRALDELEAPQPEKPLGEF